MNDEDKIDMNDDADGGELIDVTLQWYKTNVVRLIFNGRIIWETKDIALDDIVRDAQDDAANASRAACGDPIDLSMLDKFRETTLRLDMQESINYSRILLQGLQIGRLEKINTLVQLRVEQWELKVALFEMQLKQRMVDLGFTSLLKAINPDDPDSYRDCDGGEMDGDNRCCDCGDSGGDKRKGQRCDCKDCNEILSGYSECLGECEDCDGEYCNCKYCDGEYCESLGVDDIESDGDTLRLCKGCDGTRNSCAGCEDADPNDRHMSEADGESDYNAKPDYNAERANESEKSGGAGSAGSGGADGGTGSAGDTGQICDDDDIYRRD